jgi:hypothetical protein
MLKEAIAPNVPPAYDVVSADKNEPERSEGSSADTMWVRRAIARRIPDDERSEEERRLCC